MSVSRGLLVLTFLTVVPMVGRAEPDGSGAAKVEPSRRISVRVGQSVSIGYMPIQTICDDTSILRIEDSKAGALIVGVKPGTTLCGFSRGVAGAGLLSKELIEVTVVKGS